MTSGPSLVAHGGLAFLLTSAIGRLPAAMVQLGLLMYVTASGLGLELGGLTVAAVGIGTAVGAPVMGRLVDGVGPLPVVVGATVLQSAGLFAIHLMTPALVAGGLPAVALLAVAAACGFANPQMGPIVRAHWSHLSRTAGQPALVGRALGYEGAMDEMSFIVGPIAASSLVATLGPTRAILALISIIVVGQGVFVAHLVLARSQWRHRVGAEPASSTGRIPFGTLAAPMLVLLAVGITFGATQTALTAVNAERGTPELTGIIYGSVGVGSALSSLLVSRMALRFSAGARLLLGSAALLLAGLGHMLLPGLIGSLVLAVVAGLGIGVVLVTGFARAEAVAPSTRIASVMTALTMCLTLGVSAGAATAGQFTANLAWGFVPVVAAGVLALLGSCLVALGERREASTRR